LLDFLEQV